MVMRPVRNIARAIRIARTLARHGAIDVLEHLGVPKPIRAMVGFGAGKPAAGVQARLGSRLSAAAQDLGPAFIKLCPTQGIRKYNFRRPLSALMVSA